MKNDALSPHTLPLYMSHTHTYTHTISPTHTHTHTHAHTHTHTRLTNTLSAPARRTAAERAESLSCQVSSGSHVTSQLGPGAAPQQLSLPLNSSPRWETPGHDMWKKNETMSCLEMPRGARRRGSTRCVSRSKAWCPSVSGQSSALCPTKLRVHRVISTRDSGADEARAEEEIPEWTVLMEWRAGDCVPASTAAATAALTRTWAPPTDTCSHCVCVCVCVCVWERERERDSVFLYVFLCEDHLKHRHYRGRTFLEM